jgi:hypothetical protein
MLFRNMLSTLMFSSSTSTNNKDKLFENIYGYDNIKRLFRMVLESTTHATSILLSGYPASAKTLFLQSLMKLQNSFFVDCSNATKSGMIDYIFDNRPKYLLLDELDKLPKKDQTFLLNLIETGIVSETKHSKTRSMNIKTSVFATSNNVEKPPLRPRLYLVESYRLSSYLGDYGAGKTLKTFSLLPGEKTKISVKTYSKTETEAKQASSVLDSITNESTKDFETTLATEQSNKQGYQESFSYEVSGRAEASWGWGEADVSGGVKGGTNASREEFAKNMMDTTQKHATKASSKRDVQTNTSFESREERGEETSIEREIQNIVDWRFIYCYLNIN